MDFTENSPNPSRTQCKRLRRRPRLERQPPRVALRCSQPHDSPPRYWLGSTSATLAQLLRLNGRAIPAELPPKT